MQLGFLTLNMSTRPHQISAETVAFHASFERMFLDFNYYAFDIDELVDSPFLQDILKAELEFNRLCDEYKRAYDEYIKYHKETDSEYGKACDKEIGSQHRFLLYLISEATESIDEAKNVCRSRRTRRMKHAKKVNGEMPSPHAIP